ncbi:unnamed protein product [Durusdinium trenchii]|uniref:Zeta toxin domain-containing protein n=1 Tax=Durusdinium trenchii TaxID=1381693 RepID=A0ABP0LQ76_9DINO
MCHDIMSTCTAERIVVPCRGDVQIYQVVKGKIPGNLKAALSEPLSEEDVKHIFREVGLQTAQPVPPGQRPKVLWSFGPPAAGKSTLAHRRAEELFGSEGSVCVDGDEIRDRHPAFRDVTQHGLESHVLHKDAWEVLKATGVVEGLKKRILHEAIQQRQNITLPDCALKPARVMEMFKALQAADYEMHAICLWTPCQEAERRGRLRSVATGKAYSPKFHRPSRDGTIEVAHYWEQMRQSNHQFQSIEYYDTTGAPMQLEFSSFERLTETEFRRSSWRTEDGRRESLLKKLVQDERPEVEERSMSTRSRQSWWSWLWQRPLMTRFCEFCGFPLTAIGVIPLGTFGLFRILRL